MKELDECIPKNMLFKNIKNSTKMLHKKKIFFTNKTRLRKSKKLVYC